MPGAAPGLIASASVTNCIVSGSSSRWVSSTFGVVVVLEEANRDQVPVGLEVHRDVDQLGSNGAHGSGILVGWWGTSFAMGLGAHPQLGVHADRHRLERTEVGGHR